MLEAYCTPLSIQPGDPVAIHVSTDADTFDVSIERDGAVPTLVWDTRDAAGRAHPIPDDASATGCGWPATLDIPVDATWRSGYYAVTLTAGSERADACFVVRPPTRDRAPILLVLSTTTWNAYNDWGGPSLYTGGTRVSFERPFAKGFLIKPEPIGRMMQSTPDREAMGYRSWARPLGLSDWSGGAGWWNWERPFLHWAEANGYRIDVATSQDLDARPELLEGYRLSLHVGHDEYWSRGMRDALDAFVAAGGNAAIFSGNTCFWQVRFDDGHRAMTGFKYRADEDPVLGTADEHLLTGAWSDRRIGHPETSTIGLTFTRGGYSRYGLGAPDASGGYTVHRPDHWAFAGSGLGRDDGFGTRDAIVAYEVDGCAFTLRDGLPVPTHEDGAPETLEILATAPASLWTQDEQPTRYAHEPGEREHVAMALFGDASPSHVDELANNHAVMGVFDRPGGGTVFNSGVIDWAFGLKHGDPIVERITRNVLDRLGAPGR
ncbi:MAG TPA: N,N-dimethylformamidase beta subunit family domain-containing protein [Actinomycetota bacterium]